MERPLLVASDAGGTLIPPDNEMSRHVGLTEADARVLGQFLPLLRPHFTALADEIRSALEGPSDVPEVLRDALVAWMEGALGGIPEGQGAGHSQALVRWLGDQLGWPLHRLLALVATAREGLLKEAVRHELGPGERMAAVSALTRALDAQLAIILGRHGHPDPRQTAIPAGCAEILETTAVLVAVFEPDGRLRYCNRRAAQALGVASGTLDGTGWFEQCVGKDRIDAVRRLCERVLTDGGEARYEGPLATTDQGERRVRWHFARLVAPEPRICALGLDVTEEHARGIRARRTERLASLGTMAAGLAHELRNPLNAASLQLRVVQRKLGRQDQPDIEAAVRSATAAADEVQRLSLLVDEFLEFARPQPLELERLDLRALVARGVDALRPLAAEAGVTMTVPPGAASWLDGDGPALARVFENLLRNAIEAIAASKTGGSITISVAAHEEGAIVEISDDGPGIAAELPVFEPFFTTKAEGTGLGLAIVNRIVEDHGGEVRYRSRPGQTTFSVALPGVRDSSPTHRA
jgi:PAS domain S-box-containing protein